MKASWKKVVWIAAPLLVIVGSAGYAMTGGTTTEAAEGATLASNVSSQVVSSQPLSAEEAALLGGAKPAPAPVPTAASASSNTTATPTSTASSVDQATLDANNPFVVQTAPAASTAATPPAGVASNFQINQVKDMAFETNTTQGKLKVEFTQSDGKFKLEGELEGRKIEVQGEQAMQIMNQLLTGYQLQDALTATLQGKQVQLDPKVLSVIQTLDIEMKDGRKIESKGKSPTDEGKHDNGKHKGQEKQMEKGKSKKHDD
ncbi:hypothetical protein [Tumebacillus permanentifrigoris]|uniref:Uncharacterized protein n=1 Tax=Tumebacillus permanentifrigoris TaxID=378543 RepID=A0A316D6Y7_9BACL|nr:hypothetical protein [Tumebacillus permanentifrigoris]PWK09052.1 hypothetical protein C7459_114120 [Tumebacillus permanentifrigoris]